MLAKYVSSYTKYDDYFNHLMDTTCAKKKEAKELKALILKSTPKQEPPPPPQPPPEVQFIKATPVRTTQ